MYLLGSQKHDERTFKNIVFTGNMSKKVDQIVKTMWKLGKVWFTRRLRVVLQYSLSDCYKKMSKKCNSPGIFTGLVVFLDVFFRKCEKKSQNVTVRE